jgi:hypothetical protein
MAAVEVSEVAVMEGSSHAGSMPDVIVVRARAEPGMPRCAATIVRAALPSKRRRVWVSVCIIGNIVLLRLTGMVATVTACFQRCWHRSATIQSFSGSYVSDVIRSNCGGGVMDWASFEIASFPLPLERPYLLSCGRGERVISLELPFALVRLEVLEHDRGAIGDDLDHLTTGLGRVEAQPHHRVRAKPFRRARRPKPSSRCRLHRRSGRGCRDRRAPRPGSHVKGRAHGRAQPAVVWATMTIQYPSKT